MSAGHPEPAELVGAYKGILREVIERRPSGMRQRLAEALGTTRSFVSQITNPAYPTPIPATCIGKIMEICHFSDVERTRFLAAYRRAHPRRSDLAALGAEKTRTLTLTVPDFAGDGLNEQFDALVVDLVARLSRLIGATGR